MIRGPGETSQPAQSLKTAICFVIDTTISMKPYINRTREAVQRIYDAITDAGLADKVAFGLVGFRNSIEKNAGFGIHQPPVLRPGGRSAQGFV